MRTEVVVIEQQIAALEEKLEVVNEQIKKLHKECRKYRLALNRIAHPDSYEIVPGHEVEIARRCLLIGENGPALPEEAKASKLRDYGE